MCGYTILWLMRIALKFIVTLWLSSFNKVCSLHYVQHWLYSVANFPKKGAALKFTRKPTKLNSQYLASTSCTIPLPAYIHMHIICTYTCLMLMILKWTKRNKSAMQKLQFIISLVLKQICVTIMFLNTDLIIFFFTNLFQLK